MRASSAALRPPAEGLVADTIFLIDSLAAAEASETASLVRRGRGGPRPRTRLDQLAHEIHRLFLKGDVAEDAEMPRYARVVGEVLLYLCEIIGKPFDGLGRLRHRIRRARRLAKRLHEVKPLGSPAKWKDLRKRNFIKI